MFRRAPISINPASGEMLLNTADSVLARVEELFFSFTDLHKSHVELQQQYQQKQEVPNGVKDEEHEALQRRVAVLESDLKQEKDWHKKTKEQVARLSQHSVAELEIRDYTRTIAQLNEKLSAKDDCLVRSTEQLQQYEQQIVAKDSLLTERNQKIQELGDKCTVLEDVLTEVRKESLNKEREISALRDDAALFRNQVVELESRLANDAHHQSDLVRNFSKLQETVESKDRNLSQKTAEISRLNVDLTHARTQHEHVVKDFDEYKLRAQALLKQQTRSADNLQKQKEMEELLARVVELDAEIVELGQKNAELDRSLQRERQATEAGKRAMDAERIRWESSLLECEERVRGLENSQVRETGRFCRSPQAILFHRLILHISHNSVDYTEPNRIELSISRL